MMSTRRGIGSTGMDCILGDLGVTCSVYVIADLLYLVLLARLLKFCSVYRKKLDKTLSATCWYFFTG